MEGNADEFSARVMNDAKRARVTRKPLVFEMHGNMLRSLVVDANEFGDSCSSIDDGECMKAEFTHVGKSDLPRTNEVNCNFFPGNGHIIPRRKMPIRLARLLVALTNVTGLNIGFNALLHVAKKKGEYQ